MFRCARSNADAYETYAYAYASHADAHETHAHADAYETHAHAYADDDDANDILLGNGSDLFVQRRPYHDSWLLHPGLGRHFLFVHYNRVLKLLAVQHLGQRLCSAQQVSFVLR